MKSRCWICEGWVERTFTWYPESSGTLKINQTTNPLFIHFENEGWKPILMEEVQYTKISKKLIKSNEPEFKIRSEWNSVKKCFFREKILNTSFSGKDKFKITRKEKLKYEVKRMLPPGKIRYVYSSLKHVL